MKRFSTFSSIILIFLITIVLSIFLPRYYWISFEQNVQIPKVFFSPITKQFIIHKQIDKHVVYYDETFKRIPREDFESNTPYLNYRQLVFRQEMPDTILGKPVNFQEIKENNLFFSIDPEDVYFYQINLFPLIEAKPNGPQLISPQEYFRVTDKFEIFDAQTNKINAKMSKLFDEELRKYGFNFPAKNYFGEPSTRKPYHEGYFLVDNSGDIFHINRIENKPFCKKIEVPNDYKIEHILVREFPLQEFHGIIFTKNHKIALISYDNYRIIELPIKDFDLTESKFELKGDIFYRTISVFNDNSVVSYATDRNYKLISTYTEKWVNAKKSDIGKIAEYIFPFQLSLENEKNLFIDFYIEFSNWNFIFLNSILAIAILIIRKSQKQTSQKLFNAVYVLLTGIFGFIALLVIKDEF